MSPAAKKPWRRAFIEITDACNLSCSFCPAFFLRPPQPKGGVNPADIAPPGRSFMSAELFERIAAQAAPLAEMVSLHVLGEPFMHPRLPELLGICSRLGLKVNLVTNGVLLDKFGPGLFGEKCLRQFSFSLRALAGLPAETRKGHLARLARFALEKPGGLITAFRLRGEKWEPFVAETKAELQRLLPGAREGGGGEWMELAPGAFLNYGRMFNWPGESGPPREEGCLGLRHHFAVLCSGLVVPCCADYSGEMAVGDAAREPLAGILGSPRAAALRGAIAGKTPRPPLCLNCGFIR